MVSKKLIAFVAIGAALSMVAAAPVVHVGENGSPLLNQDVCTSSDCAATAAQILKDMNASADPCEDFSEFSCGGFYLNTVLPESTPSTDHLSDLGPKNSAIVRELADPLLGKAPQAAPGDTAGESNLKKLHDMYASCMDVTAIQLAGRQPLVSQLQTVLNLLPESATVDKAGLSKVMARLTKLGIQTFYTFTPGPNMYDPNLNILTGIQGGLSLPATSYNQSLPELADLESKIALQFQTFLAVEDVYANRIEPITTADVQQEWLDAAKDVVAFETLLADAIVKNPEQSKGPMGLFYNPHSFDELSAMTPSIDWSSLLSELIPAEVEYTRPLNLQAPAFLPALETILQSTSTKTLHNYFAWRLIDTQVSHLGAPYNPASDTSERWMICSNLVAVQLADITGHYFVERVLPESSQAVFRNMIKNVVSAYGEGFPALNWLDQTTLDGALKKLHAMKEVIGQSEEAPNGASSESVEEYYRGFTINANDFYGNMVQKLIWETEKAFAEINQPVPKGKLPAPPTEVNAAYFSTANRVYFYAGLIQSPWFHASNPEYVNYAGMGAVAGHEIGHGFDNSGKDFDYSGNYTSWWTPQTEKAFAEKSQCFIEQYGNYTIQGPDGQEHNLSGQKTLGENIADNGGIKYAFRAWQKRFQADIRGREYKNFKLPGLEDYTPEQMFFLSVGHAWCSKSTPEALVSQIADDEHANNKFRILGPLQNSPEFAQAFKCAPKTKMNPENKCSLW